MLLITSTTELMIILIRRQFLSFLSLSKLLYLSMSHFLLTALRVGPIHWISSFPQLTLVWLLQSVIHHFTIWSFAYQLLTQHQPTTPLKNLFTGFYSPQQLTKHLRVISHTHTSEESWSFGLLQLHSGCSSKRTRFSEAPSLHPLINVKQIVTGWTPSWKNLPTI